MPLPTNERFGLVLAVLIPLAIGLVVLVVWLSQPRASERQPINQSRPSVSGWELTNAGCYRAIGTPTEPAPGAVCGSGEVTFCVYQNQRYGIGERFAAQDECNTCVCDEATRQVVCTELACGNLNRSR